MTSEVPKKLFDRVAKKIGTKLAEARASNMSNGYSPREVAKVMRNGGYFSYSNHTYVPPDYWRTLPIEKLDSGYAYQLQLELEREAMLESSVLNMKEILKRIEISKAIENARAALTEAALHYTGWGWYNMTTVQRRKFINHIISDYPMGGEPAEKRRRRELKEEKKEQAWVIRENKAWERANPREKA